MGPLEEKKHKEAWRRYIDSGYDLSSASKYPAYDKEEVSMDKPSRKELERDDQYSRRFQT